ncbi:MAG: sensor histidine kinase [Thermodesulfobacteriota bacterium]
MGNRKLLSSVFSRLMVVLVVTGIGVNLLAGGFFLHHIFRAGREPYLRNSANYVRYLVQELGPRPSLEKAREMSRRYLLQISYSGPGYAWSTSDSMETAPFHRWRTVYRDRDVSIRAHHGRRMIRVRRDGAEFTFMLGKDSGFDWMGYVHLGLLILLLSALIAAAYAVIRWILRPVTWLHEGVGQVSAGNLDHRIDGRRSDELGELIHAFNDMVGRIRGMIQARNRLLLDVSHELRTPLTRMKVALALMPEDPARESLREDVQEMELMTATILEEARIRHAQGRIRRRPTDLGDLVAAVVREYRNARPSVEAEPLTARLVLDIDADLVAIVLRNILNNAVKHSAPDGPAVSVTVEPDPAEAAVAVRDYGCGIPEADLPFIFEPFYRGDPSRSRATGGYGFGLSLCKTIMDAHQGRIEVHSKPGEGTLMKVLFQKNMVNIQRS